VITVELPHPAPDPSAIVETLDRALGPRTSLLIVDHITSKSAWILPVAEIAARCRAVGVPILVDGAHAPGAIPVDLPSLGVDWYAGNLHKWAYSPRSCGFLWAAPERWAGIHPPVISHGLGQGFSDEFDWVGTRDPSPYLAAPEGIAFLRELGLNAVRSYNHDLAWEAGRTLTRAWGTSLEIGESMIGTMITVPLPEWMGSSDEDAGRLRDALLFEDRIEVEIHAGRGRLWARLSAQVYNDGDDVSRLAGAVAARV
jgi:isopenicillin-N epimerase